MLEIVFGEPHPELGPFKTVDPRNECLQLFVIETGELLRPKARKHKFLFGMESGFFIPLIILPPERRLSNFLQICDWIKVRSEGVVMSATVTVDDVDRPDLIEDACEMSDEHISYPWIEPGGE